MTRRTAVTVLGGALALAVTGCSADGAAETGAGGSNGAKPGGASAPPTSPRADPNAKNALTLTGPVSADTVPDMTAVVTDSSPSLPATITDSSDAEVTVSSAMRVLALDLYGTLTDTVIGLGLADLLVGRSNSDTQKALEDRPVVTKNGHDLNVEAVLNLDPDLILTNTTIGSDTQYRQLEKAGVTVVRFDQVPHIDAIEGAITAVGKTFGMVEAARTLAKHTASELEKARETVDRLRQKTPRKPRAAVLYVRGTAGIFFILGEDYGASDVLDGLGLEDVAAENGITELKPANAESLVALDPEIVLAMEQGVESSGGVDGFLGRPGMAATTAGANERVITAPDSQLLSYGPRTPQSLVALARAIYTDGS